ncbi:MAG: hypothetical protein EOM77_01870 [Bacteroidia bacterium]|nr:hypothetical protein [Bacteroidia bacterium]
MEKTFKDKTLDGLKVALEYVKKNYLGFVVILLTILLFVFLVLPAASVSVTNINYSSNQESYTLVTLLDGTESYRLSDILFGRIIQQVSATFNYVNNADSGLNNPALTRIFGVVFFPNNTFVGTGLILFIVSAILMLFPKIIVRTVGASLSFVAAILMIFIYFQVMYDIPITQTFLTVEYGVEFLAGPIVLIVTGFAIAGVSIYITVMDYIAAYKHRQSESARYLRGGV